MTRFAKFVLTNLKKSIRLLMQCRQEYKIPALYVMDSVIRQSRHQVNWSQISLRVRAFPYKGTYKPLRDVIL